MKIICGAKTLDLDKMNAVKPDGEHVWVQVMPYSYQPDRLPPESAGTYLLTSDQGAVHIGDMAFKILFDLCAWAGSGSCRYLRREIARGAGRRDDGWEPAPVRTDDPKGCGAMAEVAETLGLVSVYMPCTEKTLPCNLPALGQPSDLDGLLQGMLSDYIVADGEPFTALHRRMTDLLESFCPEDFVMFLEGMYGVVSLDRDTALAKAAEQAVQAGTEDGDAPREQEGAAAGGGQDGPGQDAPAEGGCAGGDDGSSAPKPPEGYAENVIAPDPGSPADGVSVRELAEKKVRYPGGTGLFGSGRKLKGSDLTGTDETYTLEYYARFYREDMEKADSEGFCDQLIRARAGEGVAPIAVLNDAVDRLKTALAENTSDMAQGGALRSQLTELAERIGHMAASLEAPPEDGGGTGEGSGENPTEDPEND